MSAKYSLRADLRDLTDNRYTVRALLQEELDKISSHQEDLSNKTAELTTLKLQLDESLEAIEKVQTFINKDEEGNSAYSSLLDLIFAFHCFPSLPPISWRAKNNRSGLRGARKHMVFQKSLIAFPFSL